RPAARPSQNRCVDWVKAFGCGSVVGAEWRASPRLEPIALDSAVEGGAAQAQGLGGHLDVAAAAFEGGAHEQAFGVIEGQMFEGGKAAGGSGAQAQVAGLNLVAGGEQNAALDRVLELAHVAGPGVLVQEARGG